MSKIQAASHSSLYLSDQIKASTRQAGESAASSTGLAEPAPPARCTWPCPSAASRRAPPPRPARLLPPAAPASRLCGHRGFSASSQFGSLPWPSVATEVGVPRPLTPVRDWAETSGFSLVCCGISHLLLLFFSTHRPPLSPVPLSVQISELAGVCRIQLHAMPAVLSVCSWFLVPTSLHCTNTGASAGSTLDTAGWPGPSGSGQSSGGREGDVLKLWSDGWAGVC